MEDLIPPRGDFRVVIGEFNRVSISHDFDFIEKNNLWHLMRQQLTDFDKCYLFFHFHPQHNDFTFDRNMKVLRFILREGWSEFVIRALNINLHQCKLKTPTSLILKIN